MVTDKFLTIFYTCDSCGINERPINVKAREKDENIVRWIEQVTICISNDHSRVSPDCRAERMTNVKIPISGADQIGGVINN